MNNDNEKSENIVINHLIRMSADLGEISGEVKAIKQSQESIQKLQSDSIVEIKSNIVKNSQRIESLEKTRNKAKYITSGLVAGAGMVGGVSGASVASGGVSISAKIIGIIASIFGP